MYNVVFLEQVSTYPAGSVVHATKVRYASRGEAISIYLDNGEMLSTVSRKVDVVKDSRAPDKVKAGNQDDIDLYLAGVH